MASDYAARAVSVLGQRKDPYMELGKLCGQIGAKKAAVIDALRARPDLFSIEGNLVKYVASALDAVLEHEGESLNAACRSELRAALVWSSKPFQKAFVQYAQFKHQMDSPSANTVLQLGAQSYVAAGAGVPPWVEAKESEALNMFFGLVVHHLQILGKKRATEGDMRQVLEEAGVVIEGTSRGQKRSYDDGLDVVKNRCVAQKSGHRFW
uniref:Uncharacterized protein n=1 Tax=Zooxanthella nutricula TaxID=1333877 RepID=A0A6U6FZR9_9DINO|mmetsp:Transcript_100643/g.307555  ORF Transcript_100643/g.307555 Transcript_100643/m.307555 type:complete len:209 (+) Transcript_100643:75-701(+)